jgi:hypothetical protein
MDLLTKLMICASGAAEHLVDAIEKEQDEVRAYENLRAAIRDVQAQKRFLEQQAA